MKFLLTSLLPLMAAACMSAQVCVVGVTSSGVKAGSNQPHEIRTRNTAELNQLFARINSGGIPCHNVEFPEGVIEIDGVINVLNGSGTPAPMRASGGGPFGAISIYGVTREHSVIMQTVPNQPVFRWNSNNLYVSGIYVHDLGFDNSNATPPYNSQQWGFEFRCTADGTGGNSWGFANNQFERLNISHMYVGLGLYTAKNGACGLWSTHFEDIKFYNSQRNAIYLVGGSIGQPANTMERIDILQENDPPANIASKGDPVDTAALMAIGAGGLLINSLDIEGWNSPSNELEIYGGNSTVINNLRVEHAAFTGCNPSIGFFDGDVALNGTSISWDKFSYTCTAYVFSLGSKTTSLTVNGLTLGSTVGAPSRPLTLWRVDDPNPPAKILASDLTLNGLASEWVPSTDPGLTTTLYSRYAIDGLPPEVDTLPPASAIYVGRSFLLVTHDSSIVYWCIRKAGVYQWVSH
jgi:hypothetical protein